MGCSPDSEHPFPAYAAWRSRLLRGIPLGERDRLVCFLSARLCANSTASRSTDQKKWDKTGQNTILTKLDGYAAGTYGDRCLRCPIFEAQVDRRRTAGKPLHIILPNQRRR